VPSDPVDLEIRFATPETHAAGIMPAVLSRYAQRHPRVRFVVTTANTTTPAGYAPLREQATDFMLGQIPSDFASDELNVEVLFHEKVCIVVGSASRLARAQKIEWSDLVDESWAVGPPNNPINRLLFEAFQQRGLPLPRVAIACYSLNMRGRLLGDGDFVTMCTSGALRFYRAMAPIKVLPIDLPEQARPVALVTLKARRFGPHVEDLFQLLRDEAEKVTRETP
jgi:DNA-binding transcriptional LysR family regulator